MVGRCLFLFAMAAFAFGQHPDPFVASDFTPPKGRGCPPEVRGGPCGKRLMSARSQDGLRFTRTNRIITDRADVPDLVVDRQGTIYLYYVGTDMGEVRHGLAAAISRDGGESWIFKRVLLEGFEGMSDPVDPDVQILGDGTFRLYVTTARHGERVRTWYAEGTDGLRFTNKGLAFDPPAKPLDPTTVLIDGTWHIFAGGATREPGANWHGVSTDGAWFTFHEEKLLLIDGRPHAVSNVIPIEGGYRMFAFPHRVQPVINSFFTVDGVTWTPEPGTRLEMDPAAGLESGGVKDAAVAQLPDGSFLMVYVTEIPSADAASLPWDLKFIPDPGVRMDRASLPAPAVDDSGAIHLYYQDHSAQPVRERVAVSSDGLNFPRGEVPADRAWDPRRVRLPDATWRIYQYDARTQQLRSASSADGVTFAPDPGVRYRPQPEDRGTIGVFDVFVDAAGGVVLLYIGDMYGLNNLRRAYSPPGDNGWTFSFERGDVLGDGELGGGPESFVDQRSLRLPDGRLRLFVMKRGVIYSFISQDDGRSFRQEPGVRLRPEDFPDLNVRTLHDPWVVRLPDGRYRMYVAGAVGDALGPGRFVILSATTQAPEPAPVIRGAYLMALHACDAAVADCRQPRNRQVYLAESDDGGRWNLVEGWKPYAGSVPDLILRDRTLYVYAAGENALRRYHLDTGVAEPPTAVSIEGLPSGFADPSLTLDEEGRLVLFLLHGRTGSDPAVCPPGQPTCVQRFGSATEIPGSDGTQFKLDEGDRVRIALGEPGAPRSASDPDIFFDGRRWVLYISHGLSTSVWTADQLRGSYQKLGDLALGTGGVAAGHFDSLSGRYWTYAHSVKDGVSVIRRAVHAALGDLLSEADWQTVITGPTLGLTATTRVESPRFAPLAPGR